MACVKVTAVESSVIKVDVTIDPVKIQENNCCEEVLNVLKCVRPAWFNNGEPKSLKSKVFTGGISNQLYGYYQEGKFNEDVVLMRIYGMGTELMIDRDLEKQNIQILSAAGNSQPLYAAFNNGIVYGFVQGVTLDENTVRDETIRQLIAKEMIQVHAVRPEGRELKTGLWDKIYRFLELSPDRFDDPERHKQYLAKIKPKEELRKELDELRAHLESLNSPIVFCHNDLLLKNIIYNKEKEIHTSCTWIIDSSYTELLGCSARDFPQRYVIGFLAKLVEERILKKVKLSFLMVGHTHEDIDQLFSRFSVWCGNENILTLDELIQGFEKSCKRLTLTGIRTSEVYNFNEWLKLNNIRNHSFPHVFRITLGPEKKAVIKYKKWTTDKKWLACTGSEQYILQNMTEKMISKIPPNTEKLDKEKFKHDINIVGRFYEKPEVIEWWESFFNEMDDEEDRDLEQVDILQMLRAKKQESDTVEVQPLNIDIPNIEDPIPEVIIGKSIKPTNEEEMRVGNLVLTDTPLSPEDWPQVAEVLELLLNNRVVLQPYWGKKTTTWIPACRRPKGTKIQITVNRDVIWHYGFSLTPSGYLPKNVKDLVETYEEDNL